MTWEHLKGEARQTGGVLLRRLGRALLRTIIGALPLLLLAATLELLAVEPLTDAQFVSWSSATVIWLILFVVILKRMGPGLARGAGLFILSAGTLIGAVAAFGTAVDICGAMMWGLSPSLDLTAQQIFAEFTVAVLGYLCELWLQRVEAT